MIVLQLLLLLGLLQAPKVGRRHDPDLTWLRIVVANLDKEKPWTRLYRRVLRVVAGRGRGGRGLLMLTEAGHGRESTVLGAVGGLEIRDRDRIEIGDEGVHRWAATGRIDLAGLDVLVAVVHGLHLRTMIAKHGSKRAADLRSTFYSILAQVLAGEEFWIVGGDLNWAGRIVADLLGGVFIGDGIDGIVVSRALADRLGYKVRTTRRGIRRKRSDHQEVIVDLSPKEAA